MKKFMVRLPALWVRRAQEEGRGGEESRRGRGKESGWEEEGEVRRRGEKER